MIIWSVWLSFISPCKFVSVIYLVFSIFLFKLAQSVFSFLINSFFDSEPAGCAFPHKHFLFRVPLGQWLRKCIIDCKCSFHNSENISFSFSHFNKLFVTLRVISLCFQLIAFALVSSLLALPMGMLLVVYSIILEFFTQVVRSIGSTFGGHSLARLCCEGNGVIILEDAFAVLLHRLGSVIGLLLLILLLFLNISRTSLHIQQLIIILLLLLLHY